MPIGQENQYPVAVADSASGVPKRGHSSLARYLRERRDLLEVRRERRPDVLTWVVPRNLGATAFLLHRTVLNSRHTAASLLPSGSLM